MTAASRFIEPYINTPARTVAGDIGAGAGAGASLSAYEQHGEQYTPDWLDPVAKLFAMLAGGTTGANAIQAGRRAVTGAIGAGRRTLGLDRETTLPLNEATREFFHSGDVDDAAAFVQSNASDPHAAAANIARAQSDLQDFPSGTKIESPEHAAASCFLAATRATMRNQFAFLAKALRCCIGKLSSLAALS